ncbi:MAG TPA: T9SS type A sorting domain-containing protein, partial [Bacteroidia bacterium]|nr:T9SS type A sorting domain-containing protein [Bacteroidia bacterium]
GKFTKYDDKTANHIVLLNNDGTTDSTFTGDADGDVWTTQLLKEEKVLVGGGFTNYNGVVRNRINRISFSSPLVYRFSHNDNDIKDIGSERKEPLITLYPNPTATILTIDHVLAGGSITITDALGKTLFNCNVTNSTVIVDVSNYANGIYSVIHGYKGDVQVKKIVVTR